MQVLIITYFNFFLDFLKQNPTVRKESRNSSILLQDGALWVTAFDGDLYEISATASDITGPGSIFTKQNCVQWMGNNYYFLFVYVLVTEI